SGDRRGSANAVRFLGGVLATPQPQGAGQEARAEEHQRRRFWSRNVELGHDSCEGRSDLNRALVEAWRAGAQSAVEVLDVESGVDLVQAVEDLEVRERQIDVVRPGRCGRKAATGVPPVKRRDERSRAGGIPPLLTVAADVEEAGVRRELEMVGLEQVLRAPF